MVTKKVKSSKTIVHCVLEIQFVDIRLVSLAHIPEHRISIITKACCEHTHIIPMDNNNDFLGANTLEDQAQWRDKTKELSKLVIVKQCVSRQWLDEDARKLRRIGSIIEIGV